MRQYLTPKQTKDMIAYFVQNRRNTRTLLIETIVRTGARSLEVMLLTVADVDPSGWVNVPGVKGSKARRVPIPRSLAQMLYVTLNNSPAWGLVSSSQATALRLLRNHWDAIKYDALGVGVKVTLHGLRTTFAVGIYKNAGRDVLLVKELLGHKSINSTMVYVDIAQIEQRSREVMRAAEGKLTRVNIRQKRGDK